VQAAPYDTEPFTSKEYLMPWKHRYFSYDISSLFRILRCSRREHDREFTASSLAGTKLLFDAGCRVTSQMVRAGIEPQHIDAVFITHHHYDHISSLGEFLLTAWHNGREKPVTIYGPRGTAEIVAALLGQVY
jgi:ribonuclease BN (tRNA processing enzyme)